MLLGCRTYFRSLIITMNHKHTGRNGQASNIDYALVATFSEDSDSCDFFRLNTLEAALKFLALFSKSLSSNK